jgi:hypothetical protein
MTYERYQRRPGTTVHAIQLALDTDGFDYVKWGARQHCKPGDFIVRRGNETYTVDADAFTRSYRLVRGSEYEKTGHVWAERQAQAGSVRTREGSTSFEAGDYVVFNDVERTDGYAIPGSTFEALYELAP